MAENSEIIDVIWKTICDRVENPPEKSYVCDILNHRKGVDKALEKVGEETTEFVIAVKNGNYQDTVGEAADLIFHLMLALKSADIDYYDVAAELQRRHQ